MSRSVGMDDEIFKRKIFKGRFPKITIDDEETPDAAIMYLAAKSREMGKTYESISVLNALEAALPGEILRVANPKGIMDLEQVCNNLEEEFNAPMLLYDEVDKLREFQADEDRLQRR